MSLLAVVGVDTAQVADAARVVDSAQLPGKASALLDHRDHMTVRLREHHQCALDLKVLKEVRSAGAYARQILLLRADNAAVAEVGVVRIHEQMLEPAVVDEIVARRRPLGDILLQHVQLRSVEPRWFLRFEPNPWLTPLLGPAHCHGRIGVIRCDGAAAIDVLEIVPA